MVTRTKKLFVGGLSASTTIEDVRSYFEQFGKVYTLPSLAYLITWRAGALATAVGYVRAIRVYLYNSCTNEPTMLVSRNYVMNLAPHVYCGSKQSDIWVFILHNLKFSKCLIDEGERSYYRSVNAIFSKIGRLATEAVTLQLHQSKYTPVLLYGLEACPLSKA